MKSGGTEQPGTRAAPDRAGGIRGGFIEMMRRAVRRWPPPAPRAPTLERGGIRFETRQPHQVHISLTLGNRGTEPTPATTLALRGSAFGAFLPWVPLGTVEVPPVAPGARIELVADRWVEPVPGSGGPNVPRSGSLTEALTRFAASGPPPHRAPYPVSAGARGGSAPEAAGAVPALLHAAEGRLPAGLFQALGRRVPDWPGNVEVLLGGRQVERHCAFNLRMHPGLTNRALFLVGGRPDSYRFSLSGTARFWKPALGCFRSGDFAPLPEGVWVALPAFSPLILTLQPRTGVRSGNLAVHVMRESTREVTTVELELHAGGPGDGLWTE